MRLPTIRIPFFDGGRWSYRDLADFFANDDKAETEIGDPEGRLLVRLMNAGRKLHDYRSRDRRLHYPPAEWGWFRDPKKLKPTSINDARRALPYGKRSAARTTCVMLHTAAANMGAPRFLGTPVQLAVDRRADAVLCHDLQTLCAHGHAGNRFCVGIEIAGHSDATPDQVETARALMVYVRDEVIRRRKLKGDDNERMAVMTHFMATKERGLKDPGAQIWRDVGEYAIEELGFVMGPVVGSGQPVPERWRR